MIPPFQAAAMSRVQSFPLEDSVIARRAQEIEPFVVMEVMERAQALEAEGEHLARAGQQRPVEEGKLGAHQAALLQRPL